YNFLQASAKAKIANVATNLAAIAVFALSGAPLWGLGLIMGAANMLGGLLGARTAVARGSRFVRAIFLVVVSALILRLAYDVFFA
ncbi:MAG TPA: TSUP family transporter, partial [Kribbella sp.]|nr:TSUP family transporter [Kribbella sp.]